MIVLIVHAHHEPQSFCSALKDKSIEIMTAAGHEVVVSDLYAMGWDPISDRRNFTSTADLDYLKQQKEETHATELGGFAPDIEAEMQKLEACDLMIWHFPLWWFGVPAILKGWVDRVFASGRVYGGGKWYENGLKAGQRAVICMTTGGPKTMYSDTGLNGKMTDLLYPIHHGMFYFIGFDVLQPQIAWGPARAGDDGRAAYLDAWQSRLPGLMTESTIDYLPTTAFDENFQRKT